MTDRRLLIALGALSPLLVAAPLMLGAPTDVLLAAPVVALLAPLLAGRYVGEQRLAALSGRDRSNRIPFLLRLTPRGTVGERSLPRWLLAAEQAVRPPPRGWRAVR